MQLRRCAWTDERQLNRVDAHPARGPIQNFRNEHRCVARLKPALILRREFATPVCRKASVRSGLKERCCSDARYHWSTGLIGCIRQCSAFLAWSGGDGCGETANFPNAAGALSFV
jgi:hypothetical protein